MNPVTIFNLCALAVLVFVTARNYLGTRKLARALRFKTTEANRLADQLSVAREQAEGYRDVCVDERTCHPVECVLPWEPPELELALDDVHDATSVTMRTMRDELRKQRPESPAFGGGVMAKALELQEADGEAPYREGHEYFVCDECQSHNEIDPGVRASEFEDRDDQEGMYWSATCDNDECGADLSPWVYNPGFSPEAS